MAGQMAGSMQWVGQIQSANETCRVRSGPVRSYGVPGSPGTGATSIARPGHRSRARATSHEPLKHEVGHERRRHDVVLRLARRSGCGPAQQLREIIVPLPRYEDAVRRLAQLQACPTGGVTIDDHDAPEPSLPPLLGLAELPRIECPVAAATHDRYVAHDDRIGHA